MSDGVHLPASMIGETAYEIVQKVSIIGKGQVVVKERNHNRMNITSTSTAQKPVAMRK